MTSQNQNSLDRLQNWYISMCNGDWEHTYGITIETLDNPGWNLEVELTGTGLEDVPFEFVKRQGKEDNDWVFCTKKNSVFIGSGGPKNLSEVIDIFINWTLVSVDH